MAATTDVPVVKIDGRAVFARGLQSACVRRSLNSVGHVQIRVRADDSDAPLVKVDKPLTVALTAAAGGAEQTLFAGEIVSIGVELRRMGAELVIDAYDKAHQLMRSAPVTTHLKKSPSEILSAIAESAGLSPSVESFGAKYEVYHQSGPAGQCISELCRAFGAEWWVDGTTFYVRRRSTSPPDSGVTLTSGKSLRTFAVRFTTGEQVQNQGVRGWDMAAKQAIVGTAAGVTVPLPAGVAPSAVASEASRQDGRFWSPLVLDASSANDLSAGAAAHAGAAVVTGRGECDADARIVPGTTIAVDGLGEAWNGKYYVTGVEHLIGVDQPFITRFTIGGPDEGSLLDLLGANGASPLTQLLQGLTIGIVTNNDDTEKHLNRVKVKFPYLSDADESEWARVVIPGGGPQRGLVQLPEKDDEVLVCFENGDRNKPIVIGGLWNGVDTPPITTSSPELLDGAVASRQWVSRNGHRIVLADKHSQGEQILVELQDKKASITLTKDQGIVVTAKDQQIRLNNEKSSITLADNGDITIKGAKITLEGTGDISVEGANVTVKGRSNVNLEATSALAAKGSGQVGIESSGVTSVKGSMVKVN